MKDDGSRMDPVAMQRGLQYRLTRRSLLRNTGIGVAGFSLASLLAACGSDDGAASGESVAPQDVFSGQPGDMLNFANWPFYLDQDKDKDGNVYHPTLQLFNEQTGIDVNYQDVINDNAEFFGKIQPLLAAGDDPGWDIIVISQGRYFKVLVENNWVYKLDPTKRPNFDANAAAWAKDPAYDPGNAHGMPWQSGITGIGVNRQLVNGPITKLDDLADPAKVGTNKVGMLAGDMAEFVMVNLGIDPVTSGPQEWREAADWLLFQRDSGTVRAYYGNDYLAELQAENLSVSMAWSGDVLYSQVWLLYDMEFVVPEGGGVLFIDNMMVPVGAQNPVGALQAMDFYYDPKIATMVTEWVLYMSPVPETKELIAKDAEQAFEDGDKGYAKKLEATAESPFLYPGEELLSQTSFYWTPENDEEAAEWDSIFLPISQS